MSSPADKLWERAARGVGESEEVRRVASQIEASKRAEAELRNRQQWYDTAIEAVKLVGEGGFPGYAAKNLKIKDKAGDLRPLLLNRAQLYAHEMAEKQISIRGYVRLIVLKGRQMGLSTMIGGRGYWKCTRKFGQSAYILAHELTATNNLFNMVKRYHDSIDPRFRPHTRRSNEKLLDFDRMMGGYTVGTAKASDTGRSLTQQFFHGSEVAFWPGSNDIASGVMQSIGTVPGTEIWLESTANGVGNFFHTLTMMALKGELDDFDVVFCPWHWDPGYSTPSNQVPPDFLSTLTLDDLEYAQVHELSIEQMHWRAKKISGFAAAQDGTREAGTFKFQQEYPATIEEAFLGDTANAFVRALVVMRARKAWRDYVAAHGGEKPKGVGARVLGVDPSYTGPDKFSIWGRQGRVAWKCDSWKGQKNLVSKGRCIVIFEREQPDAIFMDVGNTGGPLYDDLCETKWKDKLVPVLFGDAADEPDRYYNKRSEMWGRERAWLSENPQVYLEDRNDIQADLTSIKTARSSKPGQLKLESKDDMRKRNMPSPDDGDALGLTFAYDAAPAGSSNAPDPRRPVTYGSGLSIPSRGSHGA